MNREIKFRAWNKESDEMYEDILHDRSHDFDLNYIGDCMSFGDNEILEIMQYTGLKDKNGKEVFEGDVLRDGKGPDGVVVYNENIACFLMLSGGKTYYLNEGKPQRGNKLQYTEIIGNIYENPELINE